MISVLYVDDERDLLEVTKLFLELEDDINVTTMLSAKEALDHDIGSFDAIVSDYMMPGMDGIGFLKAVRRQYGDIPFILFTGRGREEVVIEAINNGADSYLQKGGDPDTQFAELLHRIHQSVRRRHTERSLQESEKRLADIINFLPDATFAIDKTGHVIAWNRAIEEMTGVMSADILGKGEYEYAIPFYGIRRPILIDLIFEPDTVIRERYSHIIHEKDLLIADTAFPRPMGRIVTLMGKASPLYNRQGDIVGAIESIRDITDLKKAENDLQRSEKWFRFLIQNSSDMIRIIGPDGLISYTSPSTTRVLGYDPSELIGKDPFEYLHPDDREHVRAALGEVRKETHHHAPTEYRIRHADGHYIAVEAVANNLLSVPEINGIVVTVRPITERKRAEEELRASEATLRINEERLRMAQEIGRTGSWEYSPAANTIWGSAEGLRIFGFPPVAGTYPIEAIEACIPDRGRVNKALADLISEGKEYDLEYIINPADGSPGKVIHSVARLEKDPAGNPVRVIGVIQDITTPSRVREEIAFKNVLLSTQQETLPDAILIVDENATILDYNRKFLELWGIPAGLIASRHDEPVLQYVVNQLVDPEAFLSRVRYLYDHKEENSYEELLLKDGRVFERFSSPVLGDGGKYFGRIWYFRDISARKRADSALQDEERKFRSLYTHMIEGVAIHDLLFNDKGIPEDYVIVDVNPAFEKHLNLSRDQVIGKTSRDAYGVFDPPYLDRYAKVALNGEAEVFETYFPPMDKYFSISAYRVGQGRFATIFEDISERKRAEQNLQESEEKFRGMAERISDIVLMVDKDLCLTYVSPSFLNLSGKSEADLLGKPLAIDRLTPREQELIRAAFQQNRDLKTTGPLEIAYSTPQKGSLILEFHGVPIQRDGVFQGVQLLAHDITNLRRAQDEIRSAYEQLAAAQEELRGQYDEIARSRQEVTESEDQYRTLFEGAHDAIFIADRKTFLTCNHSAEMLFGCSKDQLVNNTILDFSPEYQPDGERSQERAREKIDAALSGVPQTFEWQHVRHDHTLFDAEISLNRVLIGGTYYIQGIVRDITGRKKAETALRESEKKFSTVFENSPVAHTLVSAADGKFVDVNDAFVRGTGYAREEVLGKTAEDLQLFVVPAEREMLTTLLMEQKEIAGPEVSFRTQSGEIRTCIFSARPIAMAGKPHILSTLEDITERKKAEEALKESEELFRAVSEYSHNAICIVNEQGKITWANDQVLILGGYTREQIYSAPSFAAFVAPESSDWVLANFKKFAAGVPYEHHYQFTIIRADGERRLCTKHMTDFSDRRGRRNLVINMLDITEKAQAEEALQESESKLRRIADNAPDMIYRMALPDAKYEYISPASLALTGYTPEEFYKQPDLLKKLVHPSWQEYFRMQWDALMEGCVPPTYEFQIIDRAGQARWLNQRNMLVTDNEGRTIAIEGIITDITRQKETERELRRNELRSLAVSANAGSWIWEVDPEGIYRYSSPAVMNILGYKPEEIVGRMHFYDLFEPSIRERLTRDVFAAMEAREPFRNLENLNVHKDGRPVLLRTGGTPVFDENGAFAGYCGVDEDITEQREKEAALQAIVKSMVGTTGPDSLWQIAESVSSWLGTECVMVGEILPDQKKVRVLAMILDGNRVEDFRYTLEGTPCEDVRGKGFCYYPDNAVSLFPRAKDIVELNIRSYVGTPLRDSTGTVFGILCALSRNPLPAIPSMQEIMEIIAVKAAAEIKSIQMTRALQESEQKFRSLVEYALEGILITDLAGTVLFANNAAAQTLEVVGGGTALCGRNVMEFVAPESQPDAMRDYTEVANGHDSYLAQYKVITGKAKEIYVESIGKMITYEGKAADLISIREITERKQAEDALNWSQQMLAEAMDLANLVNWEYDVASDLFTFNDRFYALYGTTAEREGGTRMSSEAYVREFVHPDDRHLFGEAAKRAMATTDPKYFSEIEHRIIRRDGAVRHIVVRIRLEKDADGKTVRTHGANQDITDTRKAEEAVRQSEARYRLLAENVHDVIFTATMDMSLTYISPSVQVLRGFSMEEAMAQPLSEALTPASYEVILRSQEIGIEGLKEENAVLPSYTMELEFYRKDGSTVWTETIIALAFDNSRRPAGVVGVIRDITQRKMVENALMESEEKFRSLVETSPGIIWEIGISGKILYISPMVKEVLGYEPEGLVGVNFRELVLKQLQPIFLKTLATMASTSAGPLLPFEIIARHRDGRDMVLEIRPSRVTGIDGHVTGFRGVAYDTTRRKKAEEALKRANRQLNLLGSITRHDLLNKITVILGNLKIVEKKCTSPEEEEHLKKIRYATSAIKSQIEFTRVYQNLGTHEPQWIALDSVMPRPHVPPSVIMKTSVQDIEIMADPMLEKVFFNLIDNSIRHGEHVT
ncbi:PAS domain S-box protein, partial [Methanoregula sp.]|uniref:PAS domain S-box protein n=1 Tax=Methanoregula sp. TaxID=2052170 RepID=UPI000CAA62B9